MVELHDAGEGALPAGESMLPADAHETAPAPDADGTPGPAPAPRPVLPQPDVEDQPAHAPASHDGEAQPPSIVDGIRLLQRVLATPGAIQRWPMYIRNVKQAMRAVEPGFDERKHGNLVEILRSVQRDGLDPPRPRSPGRAAGVPGAATAVRIRRACPSSRSTSTSSRISSWPAAAQPPAVDVVPEPPVEVDEPQGIDTTAARLAIRTTTAPAEASGNVEPAGARPRRRRKSGTAAPQGPIHRCPQTAGARGHAA